MVWFHFYIILENANKSRVTKPITDCLETRGTARGVIKEPEDTFAGGRYVHYLEGISGMYTYVRWCTSIPTMFRGVRLTAGIWLQWKYLHHTNWQMLLQNQGHSLDSWWLNIYQPTTSYNKHFKKLIGTLNFLIVQKDSETRLKICLYQAGK